MKPTKIFASLFLAIFSIISIMCHASAMAASKPTVTADAKKTTKPAGKPLKVGNRCKGFDWARASEADRIRYCEELVKLKHYGMSEWEFFFKHLNSTFATDNTVTLRMDLDETAIELKKSFDGGGSKK